MELWGVTKLAFDTDTSNPVIFSDGKLWINSANIGTVTAGVLETPYMRLDATNGNLNIARTNYMNWENIKAWLAAKPAIFYYGIALGFFLGAVIM